MVNNGSSTKLFAGVGLAVPRLGNVRLRLHFLRRGTSGGVAQIAAGLAMASTPTGIGQVAGALLITNGIIEFGLSFASLTYNISTGGESANGLPGSLGGVGALVVARTNNYTEAETDAAINSADFGFSLVTGAGLKGVMKRSAACLLYTSDAADE